MKKVNHSRREWLKLLSGVVTGGLLVLISSMWGRANAQETFSRNLAESNGGRGLVDFEIQLSRGLRVFLPQQKAFVSTVVGLVQQGKVSRAMVNTVYTWSLRRNPSVPFPYFEFAMRALARRRGVAIP